MKSTRKNRKLNSPLPDSDRGEFSFRFFLALLRTDAANDDGGDDDDDVMFTMAMRTASAPSKILEAPVGAGRPGGVPRS